MTNLTEIVDYAVSERVMHRAIDRLLYIARNGIVFDIEQYGLDMGISYNTARHIIAGLTANGYVVQAIPPYYLHGRVGRRPALYHATDKVIEFGPVNHFWELKEGVAYAGELAHEMKRDICRDGKARFLYI